MYEKGDFVLRENNGHRCIQSNGLMCVTVGYMRYLRLYPGSSNWFMGLVERIHSVNAIKLLDEFQLTCRLMLRGSYHYTMAPKNVSVV